MSIEKIGYRAITAKEHKEKRIFAPFSQANNSLASTKTYSKYNNSYALAFLGKTEYTENEMDFRRWRKKIAQKIHKASVEYTARDWDNYTNATPENEQKVEAAFSKYMTAVSDKKDFEYLKQIAKGEISNPKLKESMEDLLKQYAENVTHKEEIEKLEMQTQKLQGTVSKYRGEIDGKKYANGDLDDKFLNEVNPIKRKAIYDARKGASGDIYAPKLIKLVKSRNEFAKKLGYDDYFSYMLDTGYKTNEKELFNLIEEMDEKTSDTYKKLSSKTEERLADTYKIPAHDLQPWHYGLEADDSPITEVNKYFKTKEMPIEIGQTLFKNMGYNTESKSLTLDLYPRDGKNQHAYSFPVDTAKDVRLLMNARPDLDTLETFEHEGGHNFYDLGISLHLPYFERDCASQATTEAIAMMHGALPVKEKSLVKMLGITPELATKLEVDRMGESLKFIRFCLHFVTFEKELYKNPDQDLKKLWYESEKKYLNRNMPKILDNRWASEKIHLVAAPAYYHSYFKAEIMWAQLYEAASKKLGNLTENPKTANLFNSKLFRLGQSLKEAGAIKHFTGKEFSTSAYCKQLEELLKYI